MELESLGLRIVAQAAFLLRWYSWRWLRGSVKPLSKMPAKRTTQTLRSGSIPKHAGYRINLGEDWSLEDLYVSPRAYEQVYFFYASLEIDLGGRYRAKIGRAYEGCPWQGGYSAVNFFNTLKYATPPELRPILISMHKSSPGYLELGLALAVAMPLSRVVRHIATTIDTCNNTYINVYKGMIERKLLRLKEKQETLEFQKYELDFIKTSSRQMAELLGFRSPAEVDSRTGHPYRTLKLLLSVYRRIRTLSEYENEKKAWLDEETSAIPTPPSGRRRKQPRRKTA